MNFVTNTDGSGYLNIEPIYNLMLYKSRYFISDNLKVMDVEQYIIDYLSEYRKLKRNYKQKKNIEGYKITYLLPIDINISEDISKLRVLTNSIVQYVAPSTKIKYLAYVKWGKGNTRYLTIILLDRHYYPNGRLIKRLRPNTRIVDDNGNLISKDKYDANKHTIKWNKGDEYEVSITMSAKIRLDDIFTQGVNSQLFTRRIAHIKKKIVHEVNRIFGIAIVHVNEFIKKLTYKQLIKTKSGMYLHVDKVKLEYDQVFYWRRRKVRCINDYIENANQILTTIQEENYSMKVLEYLKSKVEKAKKMRLTPDVEAFLNTDDIILEIAGL